MSDLRKAAQQALEWIKFYLGEPHNISPFVGARQCADDLRAALAQPDVPEAVSADSQKLRDKDDVPLERAVLVREWKAMRLAISTPRSQPQGWVLVPVEPTEEMTSAGAQSIIDGRDKRPGASWAKEAQMAYRAMLAAAPKGGA